MSDSQARQGLSEGEAVTLLDQLKAIVWRGDPDTYCFTYVSKAAETLLGYPLDDWIGDPKFWASHMHPDDASWALDFCVMNTNRLQDHEFEYRMIAADGREVWLKDVVHLVIEDGKPVESVGVMVDITDKKRAEAYQDELDEARRRQQQALQLNDTVVQGLATAKMALELDADDKASEVVADTLSNAKKIVDQLLEAAEAHSPLNGGTLVREEAAMKGTG
jgi:PAS domain S-box-containing protein